MVYYINHIKDIIGNNYLGIKVDVSIVQPFLDDLKSHLGDKYEDYINTRKRRDNNQYHMTVINVMDYNKLSKEIGMSKFVSSLDNVFKYPIDDIKMMGVGTAKRNENQTYFIVCKSDKLDAIRKRYELPEHDFHITLGFLHKDVFGVRKNEVIKKKSQLLQLLKTEFLKKENFEFLKKISNWDEDPELEIIPIELTENIFKIKVGDNIIGLSIVDNDIRVVYKFKEEKEETRIPTTELIKIFKNQ
jgi:hypothetical protein